MGGGESGRRQRGCWDTYRQTYQQQQPCTTTHDQRPNKQYASRQTTNTSYKPECVRYPQFHCNKRIRAMHKPSQQMSEEKHNNKLLKLKIKNLHITVYYGQKEIVKLSNLVKILRYTFQIPYFINVPTNFWFSIRNNTKIPEPKKVHGTSDILHREQGECLDFQSSV